MATGYAAPVPTQAVYFAGRPAWYDVNTYGSVGTGDLVDGSISGSKTVTLPIEMLTTAKTGYLAPGFATYFYNQILVEPVILNFGNSSVGQFLSFDVWNGFTVDKVLASIDEVGTVALSLTGTAGTFQELESKTFTVTVIATPPTIDAYYTLNFTDLPSVTVHVIGSSVIMLPYLYSVNAVETISFATNVLESNTGKEQRIRLRKAPRQALDVEMFLPFNELARADNLLYGWRRLIWAIPVWIERRSVTSGITAGATVVPVNTQYGDFRVGSLFMIWESPTLYEVLEITSMTTSTITIPSVVGNSYTIGATVCPVRTGPISRSPVRGTSGASGHLSVVYEIEDNIDLVGVALDNQFLSLDVWVDEQLTSGSEVPDSYQQAIETLDYVTGKHQNFGSWNRTKIAREFKLILDGLQSIWSFRLWMHRLAGKQRPFWMPTFEANFELISTGALTNPIVVKNNGFVTYASNRTTIAINTDTGWLFRSILGATDLSQTETQLSLDASVGVNASTVNYISFLEKKRLNSDVIELEWRANNVARVAIGIINIEE